MQAVSCFGYVHIHSFGIHGPQLCILLQCENKPLHLFLLQYFILGCMILPEMEGMFIFAKKTVKAETCCKLDTVFPKTPNITSNFKVCLTHVAFCRGRKLQEYDPLVHLWRLQTERLPRAYPNNPFIHAYPTIPAFPVRQCSFCDASQMFLWHLFRTVRQNFHDFVTKGKGYCVILHDTVDTVMYHHATVATDRAVDPTMTRIPYQLGAEAGQSLVSPEAPPPERLTMLTRVKKTPTLQCKYKRKMRN